MVSITYPFSDFILNNTTQLIDTMKLTRPITKTPQYIYAILQDTRELYHCLCIMPEYHKN